jgi:hypothetical protein
MMDCSSSTNYQPRQNEKETSKDFRNTLASLLKKDFLKEMYECNYYVKNCKIVKQMKKEYLYEIVNKYSILFYSILHDSFQRKYLLHQDNHLDFRIYFIDSVFSMELA